MWLQQASSPYEWLVNDNSQYTWKYTWKHVTSADKLTIWGVGRWKQPIASVAHFHFSTEEQMSAVSTNLQRITNIDFHCFAPEFFSLMTIVECRSWAAMKASRKSVGITLSWLGVVKRIRLSSNLQKSIFSCFFTVLEWKKFGSNAFLSLSPKPFLGCIQRSTAYDTRCAVLHRKKTLFL